MYQEGTPEGFVDQGLYYPASTNYGYYYTGFESPNEWEDHMIFGVDGSGIQYSGAQSESSPYLYYTPSYGYAQSPYYPYNLYIPATTSGVNGPFVEPHQYYAFPQFQDTMSGSGYFPVVQPDIVPNISAAPLLDADVTFASGPNGRNSQHGLNSTSEVVLPRNHPKPFVTQTNSLTRISGGTRAHVGSGKQSLTHSSMSTIGDINEASSHLLQNGHASRPLRGGDNSFKEKGALHSKQSKVVISSKSGLFDFESGANKQISAETGLQSMVNVGRNLNDINVNLNVLVEQHQVPKTNELRNQLILKDYTAKMEGNNVHGNIILYADQYNRDDFFVNFVKAKFFVIKSYSEDDIHKSIKYNVWSSTHHGNKKLQSAFEDAQKISAGKARGCPIFLFFSVNASGQFCGVAEMIGPVNFHKDMDFWQQEKWSGSFSVKWHIIKDVPNSRFRHIILVNNENKPVTNSRDTQEIMSKQGVEMLKIFKDHPLKTCVLDDFIFYESREKIMREEKARLAFKSFQAPVSVPAVASNPIQRQGSLVGLPPNKNDKAMERKDSHSLKKTEVMVYVQPSQNSGASDSSVGSAENSSVKSENEVASALNISSVDNIDQKDDPSQALSNATGSLTSTVPVGIVTVGSMPVKVNGFS